MITPCCRAAMLAIARSHSPRASCVNSAVVTNPIRATEACCGIVPRLWRQECGDFEGSNAQPSPAPRVGTRGVSDPHTRPAQPRAGDGRVRIAPPGAQARPAPGVVTQAPLGEQDFARMDRGGVETLRFVVDQEARLCRRRRNPDRGRRARSWRWAHQGRVGVALGTPRQSRSPRQSPTTPPKRLAPVATATAAILTQARW